MAKTVGAFNPKAVAFLAGISTFGAQVKWKSCRLPFEIRTESIDARVLQDVLLAEPDFQAMVRKEHSKSHSRVAFGFEMINGRERRKIDRVVEGDAGI